MPETIQPCPICSKRTAFSERYPRCVCQDCAARAQSKDGRSIKFFNEGLSGGFVAQYADTGEPYPDHECFIDGIPCYADEARYGGIVIQTI